MNLFVDTSVWSLALRRDQPPANPEVGLLRNALASGDSVITTGLVLQELLQGFSEPKARAQIVADFAALPMLAPDRQDHIEAATLRNSCRRGGIQVGTVDALLAQLCIRHDLVMLSTDRDFQNIATRATLTVWTG